MSSTRKGQKRLGRGVDEYQVLERRSRRSNDAAQGVVRVFYDRRTARAGTRHLLAGTPILDTADGSFTATVLLQCTAHHAAGDHFPRLYGQAEENQGGCNNPSEHGAFCPAATKYDRNPVGGFTQMTRALLAPVFDATPCPPFMHFIRAEITCLFSDMAA
jgi:hypothetical protein